MVVTIGDILRTSDDLMVTGRQPDYTIVNPAESFGNMPMSLYQKTIMDICLNDQQLVTIDPINFGDNHALGWSTNLGKTMSAGQSPFLFVGPAQRRGMHIDGTPIQELGGGRRSNVVGKIYDFVVDACYIHDATLLSVNNTAIENAKGIFEDTWQQHSLIKDDHNVPLSGHIAMEAIGFQTTIFPEGRNYAAARFTVRVYMQQLWTPVNAPF